MWYDVVVTQGIHGLCFREYEAQLTHNLATKKDQMTAPVEKNRKATSRRVAPEPASGTEDGEVIKLDGCLGTLARPWTACPTLRAKQTSHTRTKRSQQAHHMPRPSYPGTLSVAVA